MSVLGAGEMAQCVRSVVTSQTWEREMVVGLETVTVKLFFLVTAKVQWMGHEDRCVNDTDNNCNNTSSQGLDNFYYCE